MKPKRTDGRKAWRATDNHKSLFRQAFADHENAVAAQATGFESSPTSSGRAKDSARSCFVIPRSSPQPLHFEHDAYSGYPSNESAPSKAPHQSWRYCVCMTTFGPGNFGSEKQPIAIIRIPGNMVGLHQCTLVPHLEQKCFSAPGHFS